MVIAIADESIFSMAKSRSNPDKSLLRSRESSPLVPPVR
ncbi:hypothetical protein CKA32_004024 [Geitlerinema sp. FC II]|nr:hypothetical protein CKA32_004024 [Geitlerinema sp. FC II]